MLPYSNIEDVKVFANEYVNINTINRALLRLYYNDSYLASLSSLDPVDLPTVSNMLLVSTGPSTYTWKTETEVKSLLNITDSIFGLSDIDELAANMLDGYGLAWDSSKDAFVGTKTATTLDDLEDVIITSPVNLHSLVYSSEYGSFVNAFPDDFSVGYVTHITLEETGKVLLPEVTTIGQQIVITKIGTSTAVYIVPNASNKIDGQSSKSLKTFNTNELVSTIHIRSIVKADSTIEWIILSGNGTFEFIDSSLVPGSSIVIRTVTNDDLMLAPYSVTLTGIPDASEITKGIVRLATELEAQTGTATDIAVTPWGVKYWFDNYAIPFASDAEVAAGTSETVLINPLQLNTKIQSSTIGARFDSSGALVHGRGVTCTKTATGKYTVTFNTPGTYVVVATADDTGYSDPYAGGSPRIAQIQNQTTTSVDIWIKNDNKYAGYTCSYYDIAFNIICMKI